MLALILEGEVQSWKLLLLLLLLLLRRWLLTLDHSGSAPISLGWCHTWQLCVKGLAARLAEDERRVQDGDIDNAGVLLL